MVEKEKIGKKMRKKKSVHPFLKFCFLLAKSHTDLTLRFQRCLQEFPRIRGRFLQFFPADIFPTVSSNPEKTGGICRQFNNNVSACDDNHIWAVHDAEPDVLQRLPDARHVLRRDHCQGSQLEQREKRRRGGDWQFWGSDASSGRLFAQTGGI